MLLDLSVRLRHRLSGPTDILLQVEAAANAGQIVRSARTDLSAVAHQARVAAESGVGERMWLRAEGEFACDYAAVVEVTRGAPDIAGLAATPPHLLPGDTIGFLMPSRFCPADEFHNFVAEEFGALAGGAKIAAMRDWIEERFSYVAGASGPQTTALDTFVQREGVCRDYAHVLITLARAAAIPARFVSAYGPDVSPQDFHAVAEIWLDGAWRLVDATGMAAPDALAVIGVGRDAADVAFMTSYGAVEMLEQTVAVRRG